MGLSKMHRHLILAAAWIAVVVSANCLGGSALRGNDLSLLAVLVVVNLAVTVTMAVFQVSILQKCAIRVAGSSVFTDRLRGSNYALSKNKSPEEIESDRTCVLPGWGVGHIIMYGVIAAFVPRRWKELFLIGLVWELAEYPFGVSYALDLVYNAIGIALGVGVRYALTHYGNPVL